MKNTIYASLAVTALGGAAFLVPAAAHADDAVPLDSDSLATDDTTAVMGPAREYQHGLTVNGVSPTLRTVVVDGESILAYCIEYWIRAADPDHTAAVTGWDEFTGDNNFKTDSQVREQVAWILRNSHPTLSLDDIEATTGTSGLTEAEAIAATQSAIWHFTDDFVPDGNLTVESAATNNEPVSAQSADNVQAVFDYLTGEENTGLNEQQVQASVTLIEATDADVARPQGLTEIIEDEDDHVFGPVELNASTDSVGLDINTIDDAVDMEDLSILDADGELLEPSQPVTTDELWLHVPADTETGGVHIAAESTEFGYTGRLITPEPDAQRRFQTIVVVDQTSHQDSTELQLSWEKPTVVEPPPSEEPPAPEEPPSPEEPPTPTEPPAPEEPPVPEDPPTATEPPIEEAEEIHATEQLATTGPNETRNVLIGVGTLAIGAALLILNRWLRKRKAWGTAEKF
ncbi:hypothetical protein GCM10009720_20980 [Yaniella flava]|uniref:Thioester domain-containing protein n=1 Tax=Yaniella flava TaxID=287930 RepID=A0ABN2UP93_9MICC